MTRTRSAGRSATLAALAVLACMMLSVVNALAQEQGMMEEEQGLTPLQKGKAYYEAGEYAAAVKVLSTAVASVQLTGEERWQGYELLAASYIMDHRENEGRRTFIELLNENADYAGPDPDLHSALVQSEYSRAREEWQALRRGTQMMSVSDEDGGGPFYKNKWFLIGAGVAVAAAVVIIVGS
jgi:hypothetical protein